MALSADDLWPRPAKSGDREIFRCGSGDKRANGADRAATGEVCDAARGLALRHYKIEEGLTQIFRITDRAAAAFNEGEAIKLLAVNVNTPETGIMPLYFGPAPASGIPYPSVIVEVSPNEFEKIQSNELKFPEGWAIGKEIPMPAHAGAL